MPNIVCGLAIPEVKVPKYAIRTIICIQLPISLCFPVGLNQINEYTTGRCLQWV